MGGEYFEISIEDLKRIFNSDLDGEINIRGKKTGSHRWFELALTPKQFFEFVGFSIQKSIGLVPDWSDPINVTIGPNYIRVDYRPHYDFSSRHRQGVLKISYWPNKYRDDPFPVVLETMARFWQVLGRSDSEIRIRIGSLWECEIKNVEKGKVDIEEFSLKRHHSLDKNVPQNYVDFQQILRQLLEILEKTEPLRILKSQIEGMRRKRDEAVVMEAFQEGKGQEISRDERLHEAVLNLDLRVMEGAVEEDERLGKIYITIKPKNPIRRKIIVK